MMSSQAAVRCLFLRSATTSSSWPRRPPTCVTQIAAASTRVGPAAETDETNESTKAKPESPSPTHKKNLNYYEILGVSHDATSTEIREAFFKKAKQLHPDVNPSPLAKAEFAFVQEAFTVLKQPKNRELYNSRNKIEQTVMERAEDVELHWMTRKKMGPRMVWSEKLAKDMMNASVLRAQIRRKRRPGDPPVLSLHQWLKKKDEPLPEAKFAVGAGNMPFSPELRKLLLKIVGLSSVYVLAAYLYIDGIGKSASGAT